MMRALFTVSGWTGISRISGAIRDILLAAVVGTGPVAEAFFAAFRLPNMFRRIFAEGAYAAAFVPLFSDVLEKEKQALALKLPDAKGEQTEHRPGVAALFFANNAMSWLTLLLVILSSLTILFMPQVASLLVGGFKAEPQKFALTVALGRICFFYLLFMALTAHLASVLNTLGRFAAGAAAPVLLNFCLIVTLLTLMLIWPFEAATSATQDQIRPEPSHITTGSLLAWSTLIAGLGQVLVVWIAAHRTGFKARFVLPKASKAMWRLTKLMIPGTISAGILQINLLVGTRLVSSIAGAVAFLSYADRIYQLPLGLIGIGLGIVLLPKLSKLLAAKAQDEASRQITKGLFMCLFLSLPAAAALYVLAEPILIVLFERGQFTRDDTQATALALQAYALGLPAFVLNKVLLPAFFANKDTKRPMIYAFFSMLLFLALALLSIGPLGFYGVALATSLSALFNVTLLGLGAVRQFYWQPEWYLAGRSLILGLCTGLMGLALLLVLSFISSWFDQGFFWQLTGLCLLICAGLAVYFPLTLATGNLKRQDWR